MCRHAMRAGKDGNKQLGIDIDRVKCALVTYAFRPCSHSPFAPLAAGLLRASVCEPFSAEDQNKARAVSSTAAHQLLCIAAVLHHYIAKIIYRHRQGRAARQPR